MAAFALVGAVMTGCSSDDDSIIDNPQQPENTSKVETLTTTVSMDGAAATRALTADGVKTFAKGETMAVIYMNSSGNTVKAESRALEAGDLIDGGRSATFSFELDDPDKTQDVTYIYPAAMANDDGSVDYAALHYQDGSLTKLASNLDLATYTGAWNGVSLPGATLENQLAILAITLKNSAGTSTITSSITRLVLRAGTNSYSVSSSQQSKIYVAIRPTNSANIEITATDGSQNYKKSLADKTYAAGNGYSVSWRMEATDSYMDPEGIFIEDPAVEDWLREHNFTQANINALGNDAATTDKLYECYEYNCDFTVEGAGGSVEVTGITRDGNYVTSATVQLTRTAPLGAINFYLYLYADDASYQDPIPDESIEFTEDPFFPIAPTTGTVTQTATATLYVKAKTIWAALMPEITYQPEDPEEY